MAQTEPLGSHVFVSVGNENVDYISTRDILSQ